MFGGVRGARCDGGAANCLPIAAGRRAAALDLLDSTRPSLACSLAFWLLSPVCIALLARKTSDGQEGKGDHRGEGHRPRETHNSEPAERKNSASTFFSFSRGLREARGKINTSTARASKVFGKGLSLSLSLSVRSSPSLSGTCHHRFFLFYKQGGKYSNHCVNTKEDRKKRKTPPTLFNLKKNSVVSPFHLRGFFLSLRVCGGGGERVLKVKSLFTSSPARPPCSRPTRPSRPSSWRSTPSASRAPP